MDTPTENQGTLREMSDPDLIATWAKARQRLVLGTGSRESYDDLRAEYQRRIDGQS